jgi:uncharacterized protein YaeQ
MKQTLLDYGVKFKEVPLLCDNESAIKIANNPVQHSRTKHIDIRHHFLRDHVSKEISRLMELAQMINWRIYLPSLWMSFDFANREMSLMSLTSQMWLES